MNDDTIVAMYDTAAHAEAAVADLKAANVPATAISVHADNDTSAATQARPAREAGFWSSLFGGEHDDGATYDRSLQSGSTVITVTGAGEHVSSVMKILESHNPVDIDERASGYVGEAPATEKPVDKTGGTTGDTLQLSEESLAVGKRVVNRGGTRIRRFVVETPVEEQVNLHDERVTLDRRPVTDGRAVGAGSFSDKTVEMMASAEEVVVAKTARVYEEVGLRKEATDRVETVSDTVRKEKVEVEQIPGEVTSDTRKTAAAVPAKV